MFEEMGGALPGDSYVSSLYHNPGNGNHSLTLVLEGVRTNRAAFGARIEAVIAGSPGEARHDCHIFRTVGYGSSFGANPPLQHIGIGSADTVKTLRIIWPTSHTTQEFTRVAGDKTYHLREGGTLQELPLQRSIIMPMHMVQK
jgi:hypothetical protein